MNKVLIIAEAGVNHNGSIENAKKLVDAAAEAGADYVKFQTFKSENLVTKEAKKADYQKINTNNESSQFEMLKKLELSEDDHFELIEYCKIKKIKFLSTAFDEECADFLEDKVDFFKIPSGELTNLFFVEHLANKCMPIVLSTGMAVLNEIQAAVSLIHKVWEDNNFSKDNLTVLHCTTDYPTKFSDVNLKAMIEIEKKLNVRVGYSDHTLGVEVPISAVALGAKVIEKHFTLSRQMDGPDHAASLEPNELKLMVSSIRNIELALGKSDKKPTNIELNNRVAARKSACFRNSLSKGHIISRKDIIMLRPGDGISGQEVLGLLGRKLVVDVKQNDKVKHNHYE